MATSILSRSLLVLLLALLSLFSRFSISEASSLSFSFTSSDKNASFASDNIALYGGAKLVDGGSSIQLNDSVSHGGRVVYTKPLEFIKTKTEYSAGFSTEFSFSMSPNSSGRFGVVVFPVNGTMDHSLFEVMFDTSDSNVAVIVNSTTVFEKIRNFTIVKSEKEKEEKLLLYVFINYIGGGKFLEVKLSKSETFGVNALVFYRIDLSELLKDEDKFMVGMNSYSGSFNLHSWRVDVRRISKLAHSYVPHFFDDLRKEEEAKKGRRERMWEIVICFVMTFGSTWLVFFAMMRIWAAFKRSKLGMVLPEECGLKTKQFEYEKMEEMEVVMSKAEAKQERK